MDLRIKIVTLCSIAGFVVFGSVLMMVGRPSRKLPPRSVVRPRHWSNRNDTYLQNPITAHDKEPSTDSIGTTGQEEMHHLIPVNSNPFDPNFVCNTVDVDPDKIIGGQEANPHSFPWMAYMVVKIPNRKRLRCAGNLISDRWVVTAAHCFMSDQGGVRASVAWVTLGVHDVTKVAQERALVFKVYAQGIYVHQNFSWMTLMNDIALVRLPSRVPLDRAHIKTACLPLDKRQPVLKEPVIAAGWGIVSLLPKLVASKLQFIRIHVVSCNRRHNRNICALKRSDIKVDMDSCAGDSGGPLIWTDGKVKKIVGILSYGSEDCSGNFESTPTFYTRLVYYFDWMRGVIESETVPAGTAFGDSINPKYLEC